MLMKSEKMEALEKFQQMEPRKDVGCTLIGTIALIPCTIVLVQPRRMIVQEDHCFGADPGARIGGNYVGRDGEIRFYRNSQGKLHFLTKRPDSKKWRHDSMGIVIGKRAINVP